MSHKDTEGPCSRERGEVFPDQEIKSSKVLVKWVTVLQARPLDGLLLVSIPTAANSQKHVERAHTILCILQLATAPQSSHCTESNIHIRRRPGRDLQLLWALRLKGPALSLWALSSAQQARIIYLVKGSEVSSCWGVCRL